MSIKIIIIVGVSVAVVVGMFVMGRFLNRDTSEEDVVAEKRD